MGFDRVEVLTFPLDLPHESVIALERTLLVADLERAERFAFPVERRRWIVARARLRNLLGARLDVRPDLVRLELDANGKPQVRGRLRFNLSHSHELAVVALAYDREVGVDVERVRPLPRREELALEVLAAEERDALQAVPEERRDETFLVAWTRKESYLKARGVGLRLAPAEVVVSLNEPARLLSACDADRWSLHALAPATGYVGALTVARP